MIPPDREAEILRLYHAEKWRIGTIAAQLHLHHCTVRRVLEQAGIAQDQRSVRPSMADLFLPFIRETLEKYPRLRASRLYEMVKQRGYPGGPDHFRAIVARHRPRPPAEAYLRLRTLPGEQAQVDWGHFGKIEISGAFRALMAFVMVLSFSRRTFLRFYLGSSMSSFLHGHVEAFLFFNGIARTLLYDNLKSAVLERVGDAIRFHPTLLALAKHYRFLPQPVAVARGNQKGRVERKIRDIRDSFFAARVWRNIDDLNQQAAEWCLGVASDRKSPEDRTRTVRELYEDERPRLLPLPENPFPTEEQVEVEVGKTPYVRFDLNDYSVPHTHVRKTLVVIAGLDKIRIADGCETIASHTRSWGAKRQIEDPAHIAALVDEKRKGKEHRGIDRLHHALPSARQFFQAVAERGGGLGGTTSGLLKLLDAHGAEAIERAIAEALEHGTPHLGAVHQILDRHRHEQKKPPPIAVQLPDDPRVRDIVVRPHALGTYDQLKEDPHDHDEES